MKKILLFAAAFVAFVWGLTPVFAQPGPGRAGAQFGGAFDKLLGDHQTFSARLEIHTAAPDGSEITMPGKFSFDSGKVRFEMNLTEMQGSKMPLGTAQQMKSMGMDSVISISRPDLTVNYLVYPGLNSYAEVAQPNASDSSKPDDFKVEATEIGKETVDGHDCVKNKMVVTDKEGVKHESTVWNATDLKKFPIKIVMNENGNPVTMYYKNISFEKPAGSQFEPPPGFTKYNNVQTMMQTEMMKHMGGGMARPAGQN